MSNSTDNLSVSIQDRSWAGSCNACGYDMVGEKVVVISVRGCSFRLCPDCAGDLRKKLVGKTRKGKSVILVAGLR